TTWRPAATPGPGARPPEGRRWPMAWGNEELARLFSELAELLELTGETGFRVRAYDRGARALSGYGADLSGLSERELAAIPGVGKAIAAKVREYLDPGRGAEVGEAAAAGRGAGLPGMGVRTEANLRRALERMSQRMGGIPLAVALPVAEALRDRLAAVDGIERVEVAGSLRRMKAALHDIDLLG